MFIEPVLERCEPILERCDPILERWSFNISSLLKNSSISDNDTVQSRFSGFTNVARSTSTKNNIYNISKQIYGTLT